MVELVDTQDLKSCGRLGRVGSSPTPGTIVPAYLLIWWDFLILGLSLFTSRVYSTILTSNPKYHIATCTCFAKQYVLKASCSIIE